MLMKKTIICIIYLLALVTATDTSRVFATTLTGGGYTIDGQVNPTSGTSAGIGYASQVGGNSISQTVIGGLYTSRGGAYFTPSIIDVCPNIPDAQPVVPSGMIIDASGLCVTPSSGGGGTSSSGGGGGAPGVTGSSTAVVGTWRYIVSVTPKSFAPYRADPFADGHIDILDFNIMMVNWGKKKGVELTGICSDKPSTDINCDGRVDILDFNLLMIYWGVKVSNAGFVAPAASIIK
jgi:hypothetical protein